MEYEGNPIEAIGGSIFAIRDGEVYCFDPATVTWERTIWEKPAPENVESTT